MKLKKAFSQLQSTSQNHNENLQDKNDIMQQQLEEGKGRILDLN